MTTFHTDSARNPDGIRSDSGPHSALKKAASQPASQASSQGNPTSSRTEPQTLRRDDRSDERESITSQVRRIPEAAALARLVCGIRPEWSIGEVYAWALRDERPWADVVAAGINGARDRNIRQVGGLQFAGPAAPTTTQTYPTVREALADLDLCDHESVQGRCPSCRAGGEA